MIRKIIRFDEGKCNGCGACATACHEGAIAMVNGKAKLMKENFCDGLGDCLPACPANAISFEEREAPAYDAEAVRISREKEETSKSEGTMLEHWPVQMKLVPAAVPFLDGANLLIAASCTAYAYTNFHKDFIKDHVVLIGCTKLDQIDYSVKLATIFSSHDIRSITVVRMTVPCCGGMTTAVKRAIEESGKNIPLDVITISPKGAII